MVQRALVEEIMVILLCVYGMCRPALSKTHSSDTPTRFGVLLLVRMAPPSQVGVGMVPCSCGELLQQALRLLSRQARLPIKRLLLARLSI